MTNNSKRLVAGLFVALMAISGLLLYSGYANSLQQATIDPPQGAQLVLYKGSVGHEEEVGYDKNNIILSGSQKTTKKIKKGYYVYVLTPSNSDYKTKTLPIDVGDEPVTISAKLELSDSKLASVAQEQKPNAQKLLSAKYPFTMGFYSIDKIAAYGAGEWIGISLVPNTPTLDTMVAIFKLNNRQLSLATTPPSVVISQPVYPEVPIDVISAVNRLAQNFNK